MIVLLGYSFTFYNIILSQFNNLYLNAFLFQLNYYIIIYIYIYLFIVFKFDSLATLHTSLI